MSPLLRRQRLLLPAISMLGLAILFGIPALLSLPAKMPPAAQAAGAHDHASMSDAEMQRWVEDWYSKHPEVGRGSATAAVADTFFALTNPDFMFNSDGNTSTQIDTAKIIVGDAVLWRLVAGSHTVTNGTGPTDPQAGVLFDVMLNGGLPMFQFTFNNVGTFPFFCRPHVGISNMRGVVVVRSTVGVGPNDGVALGFTAGPTPNPSPGGVRFRFALRERGRVRAEVLDVRGRRIATVVDQDFEPGSFASAWNGRDDGGETAAMGVYYLRLRIAEHAQTRRFVVAH